MNENKKIIIVGGHEQACLVFDFLREQKFNTILCVVRQDDNGYDTIFPSLIARARAHDIPTLQPKNLNSKRVLSVVKNMNADIVLSLQNNMIFGEDWLQLFDRKLGIVNVHYAPLPRYGGYWPEMWAIWNEEKEFGVTMHYVEKGVDDGKIIAQSLFEINPQETRQSLYEKSSQHCFQMIKKNLVKILEKKITGLPQKQEERSYYPRGLPNDGYLDLSWDFEKQERFIRAIAFPGFAGPKIRVGEQDIALLAGVVPFYKPIQVIEQTDQNR